MEHGEIQLAGGSWQQAKDRGHQKLIADSSQLKGKTKGDLGLRISKKQKAETIESPVGAAFQS
jgi:hypothetical protein